MTRLYGFTLVRYNEVVWVTPTSIEVPLHYVMNEMKRYICHFMSCHVKLRDGLCNDCHVYIMHICNMSWMKA